MVLVCSVVSVDLVCEDLKCDYNRAGPILHVQYRIIK